MIDTSYEWKEAHRQKILPETFVEITMTVDEDITGYNALLSQWNPGNFRNAKGILHNRNVRAPMFYATLEYNLWTLDGTRQILPDAPETTPSDTYWTDDYYNNTGWVSHSNSGSVEVVFNKQRSRTPGLTITWSSEYNEYPKSFTVTLYDGGVETYSVTVTGNNSNVSVIQDALVGYDSIRIKINDWIAMNHRRRIDQIFFGQIMTMDKTDIISYEHEQSGDLLSAALPKNSITFSLNNTDGRWNPNNPSGLGKYLAERQRLSVRYGMDIDGVTEWISGGTFYLSEWNAPSNGLEAKFVARDIFEFFLNTPPDTYVGLTLAEVVTRLVTQSGLPNTVWVYADSSISETVWVFDDELGMAENIQMIANQHRCVFWQDRAGDIHIVPLDTTITSYPMELEFAYSHPEITLSKPLAQVRVTYSGTTDSDDDGVPDEKIYDFYTSTSGEIQTVKNMRIDNLADASELANWVYDTLVSRKTVSGEFRADPRLDVFDIVEIESKYGTITPVAITNIKYTYNGCFRGTYEGRVITIPEEE